MKLEANAELFRERVREAPISGNIDNPEGGFDALVQVILMFFYLISILCSGWIGGSKVVSLQCGNFNYRKKCQGQDRGYGHITQQYLILGHTTGGQHFQLEYLQRYLKNCFASFIL